MIRTYLEWLVELPWSKQTDDRLELDQARQILDADHYDLQKVKKRILEYLAVRKLAPGKKVQSDAEYLEFARAKGTTVFHPTSTCRMGSDVTAVVDERLRVHGFQGLRVADASIMPTVVSGNTNAACVMIGEKASDLILADASAKPAAKAA